VRLAVSKQGAGIDLSRTPSEELLQTAKLAKEKLRVESSICLQLGSTEVNLDRDEIAKAVQGIIDRMTQLYVESDHRAYKKEKGTSKWQVFSLFLLGGGCRLNFIRDEFKNCKPSTYNEHITTLRPLLPDDLADAQHAKDSFDLLAIAYGLSYPPPDFPKIFMPSETEQDIFEFRSTFRPDRDDLYPKP
jgi:hypothetical protein